MPQPKKKTVKKKPSQKRYLTDERVKEIALGLVNGRYFCSDQMRKSDASLLHAIFMPVIFMDAKTLREWQRDEVVHLAAPMSSVVGGRSVNGYPFFSEVIPLTRLDYEAVHALEMKLNASMKKALEGKVDGPDSTVAAAGGEGAGEQGGKARTQAG